MRLSRFEVVLQLVLLTPDAMPEPFLKISRVTPMAGEPSRFWVPSSDPSREPHLVDLDYNGQPACSCEDHMVRERQCKHIRAVQEFVATQPTSL